MAVRHSYVAKLGRAKHHLVELEREVNSFASKHPYTARERIEGKKQRRRYRLEYTSSPENTAIPVIAADVINNLRFSLDHLMCALVPPKQRRSVMFPVFFQGVWYPRRPFENKQRAKSRRRWASVTKTLPKGAVAVLKDLQPADSAGKVQNLHPIRFINALSNRDRHERLPIVATGLKGVEGTITYSDGRVLVHDLTTPGGMPSEDAVFRDGTDLPVPEGAVKMKIKGTPLIAIDLPNEERYVLLIEGLNEVADYIAGKVIPKLSPFVRPDAS